MLNNKVLKPIIKQVAKEMDLPEEVVTVAYRSLWEYSNKVIAELPIQEMRSEEDFDKYRVSINIPSLGKFYTTWDRVLGMRERFNIIQNLKNEERETSNKES